MLKKVIFKIQDGNYENGFPVLIDIIEEGKNSQRLEGNLPPAANIKEAVINWRENYHRLIDENASRGIKVKKAEVTNISYQETGNRITEEINQWLDCSSCSEWRKLQNQLRATLNEQDEVHLIIQTSDNTLRQIPWQLWSLFTDYNNSEFALSPLQYKNTQNTKKTDNVVKILAILGDSTGINTDKDKQLIEQLPGAKITFLEKPDSEAIKNKLWNEQYDIIFFAGHSSSQNSFTTGQIAINATESISIKTLKEALKHSVKLGLKLAIFNSCDGLGLATVITSIIPDVVIMREVIMNLAAQKFLEFFLGKFSTGESLFLSVRHARNRLQDLDKENETAFKFSSWLPTIFHNPAEEALTWDYLRYGKNQSHPKLGKINIFSLFASVIALPLLSLMFLVNNKPKENKLNNSEFKNEVKSRVSPENYKDDKRSVDIKKYCKRNYGSDFEAPNHNDIHTIYDWRCINKITGEDYYLTPENFVEMCKQQRNIDWASYTDEEKGFSWFCNKEKSEKF